MTVKTVSYIYHVPAVSETVPVSWCCHDKQKHSHPVPHAQPHERISTLCDAVKTKTKDPNSHTLTPFKMTNTKRVPIGWAASFLLLVVVVLDTITTRSVIIPLTRVQGFTHHSHLASSSTTMSSSTTTTQLFVGRRGGKAVPKSELPSKVCVVCGRPFT